MKISKEEKKVLKEQSKKEKLQKKEQMKQKKLQKKLQKTEIAENTEKAQNLNHNTFDINVVENTNQEIDANIEYKTRFDKDVETNADSTLSDKYVQRIGQKATKPLDELKEQTGVNINVEKKEKVGFFQKIKNALKKTKDSISYKIEQMFGNGELNDEFFEDLEDILISSDLGVETSSEIIDEMKLRIKKEKLKTADDVKAVLREIIREMVDIGSEEDIFPKVSIIVGVNGVGKTTTIGKLANFYKNMGKKVVVVAGDTFRAAASDQLTEWAKRVDVKIIKQAEGADSASVVFDGISFAKSRGFDVVLVDTAGRLHNKVNLMEELSKVNRVAMKNWDEAKFERLIVIDATTGQNAVNQVREFNQAVDLDGIILTKLDGSAKGGIVVSICNEFGIPVKFVGVGEGMEDLVPFNADEFVEGIV